MTYFKRYPPSSSLPSSFHPIPPLLALPSLPPPIFPLANFYSQLFVKSKTCLMESNARFLNIKTSRFKEDQKGAEPLAQTPSVGAVGLELSPSLTITLKESGQQHQQSKISKISRFLSGQSGAHHPLAYRPAFAFSQKWETASKEAAVSEIGFMHVTGPLQWASYALFPFLVVQLWFVSTFRVFRYDSGGWMFAAGLTLELLCLLHKLAVVVREVDFRGNFLHQMGALFNRERAIATAGNIYAVCYHCLALGVEMGSSKHLLLFLLDVVLIGYKYLVLEEIYSMIRIEVIGSRYKLFMSLFDLASNIFLMIHVFAVLLYLCTYASPDSNWHTSSPLDSLDSWVGDYIEAFYFACTTMLTVGFGDIRPTNLLEVCCILMVQLVGIMNNAYVINEIGANLSLIHERRNTLEKDIANAQKIIRANHMNNQTRTRMLDYLMRNQVANEQLSVADQETLLDKLSEEFKGEIKEDSQMRAIKKNLFILVNFTRRFQREISKKLVKAIYPPHSVLPNHAGRQRLYIVSKGMVDIVTQKKYNNRAFAQKVVKSLQVKECAKNLYINAIYGYACLFSGKPSRIKAVAKNFAVCYYFEHQDVLECIGRSSDDFERYFQIKHKVELLTLPEKYEIPTITSKREQYCPNIYYLIKKEKKRKNIGCRKYLLRSKRRLYKVYEKFEEELGMISASINESTDSFTSGLIEETQQQPQQRKATLLSSFCPQMLNNTNTPLISKPRNQQSRISATKQYMEMRRLKLQEKTNAQLNLQVFSETSKEYKNYYPKGNLTQIMERFNRRVNVKSDQDSDSMTSSRLALLKNKRKKQESITSGL